MTIFNFFKKQSFLFYYAVISLSLFSWLSLSGGIYLNVGFDGLKILVGADFRSLYEAMYFFLETGILYKPQGNIFFNTPFMTFLVIPYTLLPFLVAEIMKIILILTIYFISIRIISHNPDFSVTSHKELLLIIICFTVGFFVVQLYLLNVYMEVMLCLLLSIYCYKRSKYISGAFFLSLAVTFKIFLLPLLIVPIIARKYKTFLYAAGFFVLFFVISLVIFGAGFPLEMIDSILIDYVDHKIILFKNEIPQVFFYPGLLDIPLKLYIKHIIPLKDVRFYNILITSVYAFTSFILCLRIFIITGKDQAKDYYPEIFATLLIIILVFVFRYDFGILFFTLVPILINIKKIGRHVIKLILLMGVIYLFFYDFLKYLEMSLAADLIYLFPPQTLIGIFLNVLLFYYWFAVVKLE